MDIQKNMRGTDISLWQSKVDWAKYATDATFRNFVIIKATQVTGRGKIDPLFTSHWLGAKGAGIPRGAYHFFTTETDGESQARVFCEAVASQGDGWGELQTPLFIDVETYRNMRNIGRQAYTTSLKKCLDEVERATGKVPGIYTSASKWQELTTSPAWASRYPLWVANWMARKPKLPRGWNDYLLWQTGLGLVKGHRLPVDVNTWNGGG